MRSPHALAVAFALALLLTACGSVAPRNFHTSTGAANARSSGAQARTVDTASGALPSPADRQAITDLVQRLYAAASADDGRAACALIYRPLERSIGQDYGRTLNLGSGVPSCDAVMKKLFRSLPHQPAAVLAETQVTGVRVHGNDGYALLRSKGMPHGEISVTREGHSWKVQWVIGKESTSTY